MRIVTRVVSVLLVFGLIAAGTLPASADATQFSLGVNQAASSGGYTIVYRGLAQRQPVYDVYVGSTFAARFPSSAPSPNPGQYLSTDGKVSIVTLRIAPDGSTVSGTLTVQP
jgi:hypothetical protein